MTPYASRKFLGFARFFRIESRYIPNLRLLSLDGSLQLCRVDFGSERQRYQGSQGEAHYNDSRYSQVIHSIFPVLHPKPVTKHRCKQYGPYLTRDGKQL